MRPGWDGMRLQAAATLPRGWILEAPEHRAANARTMSAAFQLNLTVLSIGATGGGRLPVVSGLQLRRYRPEGKLGPGLSRLTGLIFPRRQT